MDQGYAAEKIGYAIGTKPNEMSDLTKMGVSLSSGVIAGVAAAVISHPADSLLSMVNKEGARMQQKSFVGYAAGTDVDNSPFRTPA